MASKTLRSFLGTFVTVAVLVAAGVAGARGVLFTASVVDDAVEEIVEEADPCEEPVESGEGEPAEEGEPEGDATRSEEGGDLEECEEPEPEEPKDEEPKEEGEAQVVLDGDRDAACDAAAGIEDDPLREDELTGLDNAISHVLENCKKNPQAPGLLNALERLSENRERKAARDEAKAERKAEGKAGKGAGGGPPAHAGPPGGGGPPGHARGGEG